MNNERRERLLAEVLEERARRLGIPLSDLAKLEQDEEPRYLRAARERAARLGISVDAVMAQDDERLARVQYPGPDCLDPEEVEQLCIAGILPAERQSHVNACGICRELLQALSGSKRHSEAFLREIRPVIAAAQAADASDSSSDAVTTMQPSTGALADLLLTVIPVAATAAGYMLVKGDRVPFSSSSNIIGVAAVALLGLVVCTYVLAARQPAVGKILRSSQGSLVGGVLIALCGLAFVLHLGTERVSATAELAEYQAQDFVLASMDSKRSGGAYLGAAELGRHVTVGFERPSPDRAIYTIAAKGLPGKLVADIQGDTGYLWRELGDERILRGSFVAGRVKQALPHSLVIEDPSGAIQTFAFGDTATSRNNVRLGSFIIAALDRTKSIVRIQAVGPSTSR